jgi:hypothetical protein
MVASLSYTWTSEFVRSYVGNAFGQLAPNASLQAGASGAFPNNPNDLFRHQFTNWSAKIHGTIEPFWSLRFTPILRHGSGAPYGRILLANFNYGNNQAILVESIGTRRQENITLIDMRVEKQIQILDQRRVGLFLDLFNMFDANTVLNLNWQTGPRFEFPTTVLPPRIAKFGVKLDW